MFDFICGNVAFKRENYIVLDNHGIGYRVYVSNFDLARIHENEEHTFQISFVLREDAVTLYGFLEPDALEVFELLRSVTSIGPKNAMSIMSHCTVGDLCEAVLTEDVHMLTQIPGVGKKTAGRLILELAEKLEPFAFSAPKKSPPRIESENAVIASEALQNLGFLRRDVEEVLLQMNLGQMTIEEIIRESIRKLS